MKAEQVRSLLLNAPLVPLFNDPDAGLCKKIIQICYDAGIRVFEFPDRFPGALEVFASLSRYCRESLPGMLLGAGTIKTSAKARDFIGAGASFLISPSIPPGVGEVCQSEDILWLPGCATPTEITLAESMGISLVKIFPVKQLGGPAFIRSMQGPFPGMKYMASGGVTANPEELRQWHAAGVSNIAMTSDLFRKDWIANGEFQQLAEKVKDTAALVDAIFFPGR